MNETADKVETFSNSYRYGIISRESYISYLLALGKSPFDAELFATEIDLEGEATNDQI